MIKGVKKMLEKDLAVASNIGKWLIIIALSGIGLYLLFWIVVMVLLAIYIGPRLRTLVKRLRDSSILKTGSTKEKCIAVMKETVLVMFPEQLNEVKFMKQAHDSIIKRCSNPKDAAQFVSSARGLANNPGFTDDDHTAPAYDSHHASAHAAAEAAKHNLTPHSGPIGHGGDLTADSGHADGLGMHTVQ